MIGRQLQEGKMYLGRCQLYFWKVFFLLVCSMLFVKAAVAGDLEIQSPLGLKECIRLALQYNPDLERSRIEEQFQARGQDLARSAFFPGLSVQGGYYRFEDPNRIVMAQENNQPGIYDKDLFSGLIRLSVPIYQGGRRIYNLQIARLATSYAGFGKVISRQDLLLNLAATYYKILQTRKARQSARSSLAALDAELKRIDLQLDVGRAAPVDRMKVAVRQAELGVDLQSLQSDEQVLLARLAQLIGLAEQRVQVKGILSMRTVRLVDVSTALEEARRLRPELAAARARLQQAGLQVKNSMAERLPELSLVVDYGLKSGSPYDQDGPAGSIDHQGYWSAGVNMQWSLFKGGGISYRVHRARLAVRKAKQALRALSLAIREEVSAARARIVTARKRLLVSDQNRHTAQEVLRIERLKYENGKNSINDVLDAQAAWYRAELGYAKGVADFNLASLEWSRALGQDLEQVLLEEQVSWSRKKEK